MIEVSDVPIAFRRCECGVKWRLGSWHPNTRNPLYWLRWAWLDAGWRADRRCNARPRKARR